MRQWQRPLASTDSDKSRRVHQKERDKFSGRYKSVYQRYVFISTNHGIRDL